MEPQKPYLAGWQGPGHGAEDQDGRWRPGLLQLRDLSLGAGQAWLSCHITWRGAPRPPGVVVLELLSTLNAGMEALTSSCMSGPHWGEAGVGEFKIPFLLSFIFVFNLGARGVEKSPGNV